MRPPPVSFHGGPLEWSPLSYVTLQLYEVGASRYPAPCIPLDGVPLVREHAGTQHLAVLHRLEHHAAPLPPLLLALAAHDVRPRKRSTTSGWYRCSMVNAGALALVA